MLRLTVPRAWSDLSDAQLRYVLTLMAAGFTHERLAACCLLRWNGLRPARTLVPPPEGISVLRRGGEALPVQTDCLAAATHSLAYLAEPPGEPVRPAEWDGRRAIDAHLHGVPFAIYLQVENLLQAYLAAPHPRDPAPLLRLWALLYPEAQGAGSAGGLARRYCRRLLRFCGRGRPRSQHFRKPQRPSPRALCALLWATGLKAHLAAAFPSLFRPAPADGSATSPPDMAALMNAELRALNGGDITRNAAVLSADTWEALAELDARCAENSKQ